MKADIEIYNGLFRIDRRNIKGIAIYSMRCVTDENLFEFLLYICKEKVQTIIITNAVLSDAGFTILFEFLED